MISSRRNETVKAIRALRRRQGEQAVLEGPKLIEEALDGALALESALMTPAFAASPRGLALAARLPRPPLLVEPAVLAELADADSPQGALAVARLVRSGVEALPVRSGARYLYLDGLQDPGNLGAIARVAEAFGVAALALSPGCVHPNHARALRASAGSLLRLAVAREVSPAALDERLAGAGAVWAALEAHGGEPLPARSPSETLILALGSEGAGLSPAARERARRIWTIPVGGRVESLNVAVAAGIALHALTAPVPG